MNFNVIIDVPDFIQSLIHSYTDDVRVPSRIYNLGMIGPRATSNNDIIYLPLHLSRTTPNHYRHAILQGATVDYERRLAIPNKPLVYLNAYHVDTQIDYPILRELENVTTPALRYIPNQNLYKVVSRERILARRILEHVINPNLAIFESTNGGVSSLKLLQGSNLRKLSINFQGDPFTGEELKYLPKTMRTLEIYRPSNFDAANFKYLTDIPLISMELNIGDIPERYLRLLPWKTLKNITFISRVVLYDPLYLDCDVDLRTYAILQKYHVVYPGVKIMMNPLGEWKGFQVTRDFYPRDVDI